MSSQSRGELATFQQIDGDLLNIEVEHERSMFTVICFGQGVSQEDMGQFCECSVVFFVMEV